MIDNLEVVNELLNFDLPDTFYNIEVMKRSKDNEGMVGKEYIWSRRFTTIGEYNANLRTAKNLATLTNSRVYVDIAPRSISKFCSELKNLVLNSKQKPLVVNDFMYPLSHSRNVLSDQSNIWLVDVDDYMLPILPDLKTMLPEIIKEVPSKTGVHLIIPKFDIDSVFHNGSPDDGIELFEYKGRTFNVFTRCLLIAFYPGK